MHLLSRNDWLDRFGVGNLPASRSHFTPKDTVAAAIRAKGEALPEAWRKGGRMGVPRGTPET